jgi:glycosyltransferase involved in cell wall biosynthesis
LADVDLVVVENLLTIPLNLVASRAVARVLAGRPALVHHHDPPWHRARFAHITELPATDPAWRHVAINRQLQHELAERGIDSTVIYNGFELPEPRTAPQRAQLRDRVRSSVGLELDVTVVAHPVRAIERKNLPAAIALCERLGAVYWLLGPAEEGYGDELARLLAAARCPVVHRPWSDTAGIYAAADHITFPSTWEGFGNPPIEAALHRRTVSVGDYPVAHELRGFGFEWFAPDDVEVIRSAIDSPDDPANVARLDRNERIARAHFSVERVRAELHSLLDEAGWMP